VFFAADKSMVSRASSFGSVRVDGKKSSLTLNDGLIDLVAWMGCFSFCGEVKLKLGWIEDFTLILLAFRVEAAEKLPSLMFSLLLLLKVEAAVDVSEAEFFDLFELPLLQTELSAKPGNTRIPSSV
jgi:hypothetical protein